MPDPQRDIAPIIEPAAPPAPPAGPPDYVLPVALSVGGLLLIVALVWHWRRRAPLRALRKLAHAPDPVAAAAALAALVASQHIAPPRFWQEELELLRFGPPSEYADAILARLCRSAESFLRLR
jgi:hypothetical protein